MNDDQKAIKWIKRQTDETARGVKAVGIDDICLDPDDELDKQAAPWKLL